MEKQKNNEKGNPKPFTEDTIEWWIKWVRIHNKKEINEEQAKVELYQLQDFISGLKSLYNKKGSKK